MKENIIKSLILKSTSYYNGDEEIERLACLTKAKELAIKYNLQNLYNKLYNVYVNSVKNDKNNNKIFTFEEFINLFYINGRGNLVLKYNENGENKYITIVKCKNGSFLVRGDNISKFFLNEIAAFNYIYETIDLSSIKENGCDF